MQDLGSRDPRLPTPDWNSLWTRALIVCMPTLIKCGTHPAKSRSVQFYPRMPKYINWHAASPGFKLSSLAYNRLRPITKEYFHGGARKIDLPGWQFWTPKSLVIFKKNFREVRKKLQLKLVDILKKLKSLELVSTHRAHFTSLSAKTPFPTLHTYVFYQVFQFNKMCEISAIIGCTLSKLMIPFLFPCSDKTLKIFTRWWGPVVDIII